MCEWTGKELNETIPAEGCPAINLTENVGDNRLDLEKNRFFAESANLVWKIRRERGVRNEGEFTTPNEVRSKWVAAVNLRLD